MNWERIFVRIQAVCLAVMFLCAATWGPSRVIDLLLHAGPPFAGETVPRQIPYRGYIEKDGAPFSSAGVPMEFRLYGIDGGILHTEGRSAVVVQQGHFAVELGDSTPIPQTVLRQNFLELEIGVGAPLQVLQGRQRVLTTPYSARAGDVSVATEDLSIGRDLRVAGGLSIDGGIVVDGLVQAKGGLSQPSYVARFAKQSTLTGTGLFSVSFNNQEVVEDTAGFFQNGTVVIPKAGHYLVNVSGAVPFGTNNWLALSISAQVYEILTVSAASPVAGIKANGSAIRYFSTGQTVTLGVQANSVSTPIDAVTIEIFRLGD